MEAYVVTAGLFNNLGLTAEEGIVYAMVSHWSGEAGVAVPTVVQDTVGFLNISTERAHKIVNSLVKKKLINWMKNGDDIIAWLPEDDDVEVVQQMKKAGPKFFGYDVDN